MIRIYGVGRAGRRGGKSDGKAMGSTCGLHLKLVVLRSGEADGSLSVAVECVDIRGKNSGEGGRVESN